MDAAAFDHGYVDVIDHLLNLGGSRGTTVNMACPGESTITMVAGGCPWTLAGDPLHFPVDGPQLDAAVRFLTAHREHVPLVTLTVWGNDVVAFEQRCNFELACIAALAPTEIAAIGTRLASVGRGDPPRRAGGHDRRDRPVGHRDRRPRRRSIR